MSVKTNKRHLYAKIFRAKRDIGGYVLEIDGDRFFCRSYENACHCLMYIICRDELKTDC